MHRCRSRQRAPQVGINGRYICTSGVARSYPFLHILALPNQRVPALCKFSAPQPLGVNGVRQRALLLRPAVSDASLPYRLPVWARITLKKQPRPTFCVLISPPYSTLPSPASCIVFATSPILPAAQFYQPSCRQSQRRPRVCLAGTACWRLLRRFVSARSRWVA